MTIDSSVVLAIIFCEPESERFQRAIAGAPVRIMSWVNWLESIMVISARRPPAAVAAELSLLAEMRIQPVAFSADHAHAARVAFQRFGKGRHPARLNLGDCCAYATAMVSGEPLLFKGNDFAQTDVLRAPW